MKRKILSLYIFIDDNGSVKIISIRDVVDAFD
jgi:hypothetical protein